MQKNDSISGIVFGIQRFSIHDGPGIRTTVFLKGCNINCRWCHNPEGIPLKPIIGFNLERCVHCGKCINTCPNECHIIRDVRHSFDRTNCIVCGKCVDACPTGALELIGKRLTVDEVMQAVRKDKRYYKEGGGITLSGGEALLQKAFTLELLRRCKSEGIHCALETNGVHRIETYEEVLPYVDLFLLDYKATDPKTHRKYVGCGNEKILDTIKRLYDKKAKILIRCPIIHGVNDNEEHFNAIIELTKTYPDLVGAEILPYHKLGVSKAKRIDTYYQEFEMVPTSVSDGWKQYILEHGGKLINAK